MAFKILVFLGIIAAISAAPIEINPYQELDQSNPTLPIGNGYLGKNLNEVQNYENNHNQDYHEPAEYEFHYSVNDLHTGDIKSHQEIRKGDAVQGRYELIDSDGHKRIVEYRADDKTGFIAVVHREPTDIKIPQPGLQQNYGSNYQHQSPQQIQPDSYQYGYLHEKDTIPDPIYQEDNVKYVPEESETEKDSSEYSQNYDEDENNSGGIDYAQNHAPYDRLQENHNT